VDDFFKKICSVADPECLSRIAGLDFCPSRIQKPQQKRWVKKFLSYHFCSNKYHKIKNYFIFEQVKKKLWVNLQIILVLFTQKIVIQLSKIWVLDPRSGIRKKPILDPRSRGQKGTASRIRIRNTADMKGPKPDIRRVGVEGCSFHSLIQEIISLADLLGFQSFVGRVPNPFLFCHSYLHLTLFFGLDQDPFFRACRLPYPTL
jgi:hypothetical protein